MVEGSIIAFCQVSALKLCTLIHILFSCDWLKGEVDIFSEENVKVVSVDSEHCLRPFGYKMLTGKGNNISFSIL